MSDNNIIGSSTFTEIELSLIAVGLYLVISPIHGVSAITGPILKKLKIKTPTGLLLFSGFLFGLIYYILITIVLKPIYDKVKNVRVTGFKVGAQQGDPEGIVETRGSPIPGSDHHNHEHGNLEHGAPVPAQEPAAPSPPNNATRNSRSR